MTIKEFCSKSHISEQLIRAVVRQAGGWESFTGMADDVTNGIYTHNYLPVS